MCRHSWVRLRLFYKTNWTVHRTLWFSDAARGRYVGKCMFRGKKKGLLVNLSIRHCSNEPALSLSAVNHIKSRYTF